MAIKEIIVNKKAFHDYEIIERYEAGMSLVGTEIKSLRKGKVQLKEAYVSFVSGETFIKGMHIAQYDQGNRFNHDPKRDRKLLVHAKEVRELQLKTEAKGLTLVPLKMFLKHGKVKVDLGVCRGKALHDKRDALKKKAMTRDLERYG